MKMYFKISFFRNFRDTHTSFTNIRSGFCLGDIGKLIKIFFAYNVYVIYNIHYI